MKICDSISRFSFNECQKMINFIFGGNFIRLYEFCFLAAKIGIQSMLAKIIKDISPLGKTSQKKGCAGEIPRSDNPL